jgi:hypothetical protein
MSDSLITLIGIVITAISAVIVALINNNRDKSRKGETPVGGTTTISGVWGQSSESNAKPFWNTRLIIVIIIVIAIAAGTFLILARPPIPPSMPTATFTPLPKPTETATTQPTKTPIGTTYSVRFVGYFFYGSQAPRNVYYYTDDGDRQFLAAIGSSIDKTFQVRFARSLRVQVELDAGTVWHEELYVNGKRVASGNTDSSGVTYQAP